MAGVPTVLITGCSSGFGLETARLFLDKGWRVIATMRTPQHDLLPPSERLRIVQLDVTDPGSVQRCIASAGPIDALVNNAGFGLMGALEGVSQELAKAVFETNTFGTIAMTRAVLPQFRERRQGVIVNVSSSVTYKPLPLLSIYTASKAAVDAFTGSLALELADFGIRAHLVSPGRSPATKFGAKARQLIADTIPAAYAEFAQRVLSAMGNANSPVTLERDVAEAVWRAVTEPGTPTRIPAGADAVLLAGA